MSVDTICNCQKKVTYHQIYVERDEEKEGKEGKKWERREKRERKGGKEEEWWKREWKMKGGEKRGG